MNDTSTAPGPERAGEGMVDDQALNRVIDRYLTHRLSLEEALGELERFAPPNELWWSLQTRLYLIRLHGQRQNIRILTTALGALIVIIVVLLLYILLFHAR